MRSVSLIIGIVWMALTKSFGQLVPLYPDVQSTYQFNLASISPAHVPEEGKLIFGGIYKFVSGEPNLALFDINAGYAFREGKQNTKLLRVNFTNEKEGPYITTPRGNLTFAYQINLSKEVKLSSGIAFGFVSRQFTAPSSTGKGSATLPDGHFGLELQLKHLMFGATLSQFLNSEDQVIESRTLLKTYYQLYASWKQKLGFDWSLQENVLFRFLPDVTNQVIGGAALYYKELYGLGVMYYQRRGTAFQLTATLDNEQYPLIVNVGYNSSLLAQSPIWVNSFEIGLKLIFH